MRNVKAKAIAVVVGIVSFVLAAGAAWSIGN